MNEKDFREFGKAAVDYIADYSENIRERRVLPNVEPGYLSQLLPKEAPDDPESWQEVLKDVEETIMPGVSNVNGVRYLIYNCSVLVFILLNDCFNTFQFPFLILFDCIGPGKSKR